MHTTFSTVSVSRQTSCLAIIKTFEKNGGVNPKKNKKIFQFLQKETICMRKNQAAMVVVVAEWVRNGKISARHILRFKGQKSTFFNALH